MKRFAGFAAILILLLSMPGLARDTEQKNETNHQNTIKSLLEGLQSENIGLKTSCAYMLGELKSTEAIIPLMRILRNCNCEEARIASALALYKIGTPLSINAVRQAGIFDESKRVTRMATNFYFDYLRNKTGNQDAPDSLIAER
jgi:HEAT repeats